MENQRTQRVAKADLAQWLILCFGLLVVVISVWIDHKWISAIGLSLGVALLTTGGIALYHSLLEIDAVHLIEKRIEFQQFLQQIGLIKVHTSAPDDWIYSYFPRARRIDIMANTGYATFMRAEDRLATALAKGCELRVLLSHPRTYVQLKGPLLDSHSAHAPVSNELRQSLQRLAGAQRHGGRVLLRFLTGLPSGSLIIVDHGDGGKLRYGPYFPHLPNVKVPGFDFTSEGSLFSTYNGIFDKIWETSASDEVTDITAFLNETYDEVAASHQ